MDFVEDDEEDDERDVGMPDSNEKLVEIQKFCIWIDSSFSESNVSRACLWLTLLRCDLTTSTGSIADRNSKNSGQAENKKDENDGELHPLLYGLITQV